MSNISNDKNLKRFRKKTTRKIKSTNLKFDLKNRLNNTPLWVRLGVLVITLNMLIPLMTFGYYNYYSPTTILIVMFAIMLSFPLLFLFSSIRPSKISLPDYNSLRFKYRVKKLFQKPRNRLKSLISIFLFVFFSVVICIMIFGFNLLLEGLIIYAIISPIFCILIPNSLKKTKSKPKESSLSWVNEKNRIKQLKQRYRVFKNKIFTQKDKSLRIKAIVVTINLIVFPMIIGWSAMSLEKEALSTPSFALVSQTFRRDGIEYNLGDLDYIDDLEDLEDVTFNSLMVLRFSLGVSSTKSITIHTELHPIEVEVPDNSPIETKALIRTHKFSSRALRGPFSNKDIFVQIDLDKESASVLPGKYELEIYSIVQEGFLLNKISNSYKYNITIEKGLLAFNPDYNDEITPLRTTRRGSIYSIENKENLGVKKWSVFIGNNPFP